MSENLCCIKGCEKPVLALGLCNNHWKANRAHGSPVAVRPLSALNRGLTYEQKFWRSVRKADGCWLWTAATDKDGYGLLAATYNGVKTTKAHRFSYMLHTGELISPHQLVMHSCDNPTCVRPDHLKAGSTSENVQDMICKGRHVAGRMAASAKLAKVSDDQVREILSDPRPYAEVAAAYGLHKQHILAIKSRTARQYVNAEGIEIVRNKRGASGEDRSEIFTEDDIRAIRSSAETYSVLASRYGVTVATICDIRKRRSWKHVE